MVLEALSFAKQVLLGTAIADATLRRRSINQQANIRVGHTISKAEYLFWKFKHLRKLVEIRNFNMTDGGVYAKSPTDYVYFQSLSSPIITEVHSLVYKDGRKYISNEFLSQINEVALAVWFMDDGSYDKHRDNLSYVLSTHAFSLAEIELLTNHLWNKYGLSPRIQHIKNGDKYALHFRRYDTWAIEDILKPIVEQVHCMQYKLASSHDTQPSRKIA